MMFTTLAGVLVSNFYSQILTELTREIDSIVSFNVSIME
jgi:hypothetical protein